MKLAQGAKQQDVAPNQKHFGLYYQGKGTLIQGVFLTFDGFFSDLQQAIRRTEVTGDLFDFDQHSSDNDALRKLKAYFRKKTKAGGRIIFIGNGGSAAISSHLATDYTKNGGIRAIALNDAPTLTCLANDFGYENVFAKQLEYYATPKDVAVIISSSGKSPNIIAAARSCEEIPLITFSGMNPNNQLRRLGDLNFYTPAGDYGLVELTHFTLLHSIVSVQ